MSSNGMIMNGFTKHVEIAAAGGRYAGDGLPEI